MSNAKKLSKQGYKKMSKEKKAHVKANNPVKYYGRKYVPKGSFATGGTAIGSAIGGPAGGALGGALGQVLSKVVGFGDYYVDDNSIMKGGLSPPEIVNSVNRGGIIVRHREYLGDINAATAFTVKNYPINPGLPSSFPWLSNIASAFEEYELRGLIYEFKSLSSDAILSSATSSALGYVAMATQYNAASDNFQSKLELENYEFANSNKPSCSFVHPVECKKRLNVDTHLYIRTGGVPTGQDQRLYDLGDFNIAVGGCQASTGVLGELWCTYEIEFFHPKYDTAAGRFCDHWYNTAPSGVNPFGTVFNKSKNSNMDLTITGTKITWPAWVSTGNYMVSINWGASSSVVIAAPTFTPANCNIYSFWGNGVYPTQNVPAAGVVSQYYTIQFAVSLVDANASITISGGTLPVSGGTPNCEIVVSAIPDTF